MLRDATLREVTNVVKRECEALCRKDRVPSYLKSAAKSSETGSIQVTMIAMAAAILLKARSKRMSKVQTLVPVIYWTCS